MPRSTSKDVARLAGVSRTTVSMILNNSPDARISESTRERVLKAMAQLNYSPNQVARGLKTNRTHTLALVIPSITNPFYAHVAQGVEDIAHAHGYTVFLCNAYRNTDREGKYVRALLQRQVDGVILVGAPSGLHVAEELVAEGVVVVTLDREVICPGVERILVDHFRGGWMAADLLHRLGHREVAYISGPIHNMARRDRLDGFRAAFAEHGLEFPAAHLLTGPAEASARQDDYELRNGHRLAKEVLTRLPQVTAIACINDMSAIGVLQALHEAGLRVPDDMSVIGYDDIPLARIIQPGLTTVGQPQYERGKAAAECLMHRLQGKTQDAPPPFFTPWLVERETTCAPRASGTTGA
ncbi:MAG: LacI family DNA-binding transcriptional regulator [Bacteroidota bacterium]